MAVALQMRGMLARPLFLMQFQHSGCMFSSLACNSSRYMCALKQLLLFVITASGCGANRKATGRACRWRSSCFVPFRQQAFDVLGQGSICASILSAAAEVL